MVEPAHGERGQWVLLLVLVAVGVTLVGAYLGMVGQTETMRRLGVVLAVVPMLLVLGAVFFMPDINAKSREERCRELQLFYADNPGDSNLDRRRDYNQFCL